MSLGWITILNCTLRAYKITPLRNSISFKWQWTSMEDTNTRALASRDRLRKHSFLTQFKDDQVLVPAHLPEPESSLPYNINCVRSHHCDSQCNEFSIAEARRSAWRDAPIHVGLHETDTGGAGGHRLASKNPGRHSGSPDAVEVLTGNRLCSSAHRSQACILGLILYLTAMSVKWILLQTHTLSEVLASVWDPWHPAGPSVEPNVSQASQTTPGLPPEWGCCMWSIYQWYTCSNSYYVP